ncbi:Rib/alpha-like domain-containing protein [Facklamia languida]
MPVIVGKDTRTDAEKNDPEAATSAEGTTLETELNVLPKAEEGIGNKDKLTNVKQYVWSQTPDVSKVGDTTGKVLIQYNDGSTDEVEVPVKVVDSRKDNEKNPAVDPAKTEVKDKTKLTDEEKAKVEEEVKKTNPEATDVTVGDDGSVTITYPDDSTNTLTPDQTITEKTPAEEYQAIFNGNGGTPTTQKVTVKDGEVVSGVVEPTREGYKFVKWVKLGTDNEFDLSTPFSKDLLESDKSVIFTAVWEKVEEETPAEEYLAIFNGNGGTPTTQKVTVKDGEVVSGVTEPTREGYKFVKWVKLGTDNTFDLSEPFNKDILGEEKSVIFTAVWEKNVSENGGSAIFYPKETHPIFKVVGDELTEEEIQNAIVVLGLDKSKYTVTINEDQVVPTTDKPGDYIIDVTINYEDGTTDDAQVAIIITEPADTTAPVIDAANVIAVEGQLIPPVMVDVDDLDVTVTVEGLPEGLTYNPETKQIEGTVPKAEDWGDKEEKTITATIKAVDEAGNESTKEITVTILRDTDGDGTPDVTDEDDDNDGVTDEVEKEKGTDPKDANERPLVPIEEIPGTDITNKDQTVTEKNPIKDITITPSEEDATVTVGELPDGLTYDEETGTVSGTPEIDDWGKDEEERKITVPVTTENPDGTQTTEDVTITVERDTDGDGTPDKQDEDDDNDGVTDEVEKEKGTDPKDPNSKPGKITDSIDPVIPDRTEVGDVDDLTESEREHVKEAIEEANKDNFPEGTKVTVNEDGSATITYPDGSKDNIKAEDLIKQAEEETSQADQIDPVIPERTEVGDVDDLTQSEREHVKEAIEEANKDNFPEGTDVTVNEDGSATITYPDGSKDNIKAEDLIKQAEEETSQADQIDPVIPERTEVGDVDDLTQSEREHVKEAIEEANKDNFPEGTDVTVNEDGSATITYPDGSKDNIKAEDLIKQAEEETSQADQIDPILPDRTEVGDVDDLTQSEREHVKEAIEEANKDKFPEGTDVTVNEDGSATITYPDGSKDSIPADQLIFQREDDSDAEDDDQPSLADQIDITLPEKTGVKDINNLTEIEKEKVKIAITDANKLPKGTEVLVGSKGDVIINYPDGSHDVISREDLVYQLADSETGKPADPDKGGTPSEPGTGDADKGSDDASDSKGGDEDSSKDKDSKGGDQGSSKDSKAKDSQDKLPQTGESSSAAILGLAGLSIMAGLGLVAGRRKEDN